MTAQSKTFRLTLALLSAGSTLALSAAAHANGFAVHEISVEALGRANAGQVAADGASALWWNPAAITRSGRELSVGVHRRDHSTEFSDRGSTITRPIPPAGLTTSVGGRSTISDVSQDFTALNGAVALPIGDRFAAGLSVTQPFHLETEFGANGWPRYDTIRSKIAATDVQLSGSVRANEWLDLGVGVSAQRVDAYLDSAYPNLNPTAPDALSRLTADDWAYGWTAGAQAHLPDITFGVSYRSAIKHEMDGTLQVSGLLAPLDGANFSSPASTRFTLPWTLTAGARWAATPELTISTQVVRWGWSKYDFINVTFAGGSAAIPQQFQDTTSLSIGADYVLNDMWTVRAGVDFDPTPTPDTLREPGVFDADRRVYAVGASAALAPAVTLHGALAYTDFSASPLADTDLFYGGTPAQTIVFERGSFDGHGLTASLGLDWKF